MKRETAAIKCLSVVAQINLGFYDEEGNLVGEQTFPQHDGQVLTAKLFHPHGEQLALLIEECVRQAWAKLNQQAQPEPTASESVPPAENAETQQPCESEAAVGGRR